MGPNNLGEVQLLRRVAAGVQQRNRRLIRLSLYGSHPEVWLWGRNPLHLLDLSRALFSSLPFYLYLLLSFDPIFFISLSIYLSIYLSISLSTTKFSKTDERYNGLCNILGEWRIWGCWWAWSLITQHPTQSSASPSSGRISGQLPTTSGSGQWKSFSGELKRPANCFFHQHG